MATDLPRYRRTLASLICGLLWTAMGHAHEAGPAAWPDTPGLRLGASAAVGYLDARHPMPATRLGGVLGLGDRPSDLRGWHLEHATVDLSARVHPLMAASFAAGWHGKDPGHVEAAWAELRPRVGSALSLGVGRQRVTLGTTLTMAGHFDRFGQMPLVKRAAFNGDWIEDGVNLGWRPFDMLFDAILIESVDLGLWRGRRFPGSEDAGWAPLIHLRAGWRDITVDAFATRIRARKRGAYVEQANSGHVHAAPECTTSLRGVVCMDGPVDLFGGSASWQTPLPGLTLTAAGVARREHGDLYSINGNTRYRGRVHGGWLDAAWQFHPKWMVAVRQEWLRARNAVDGPGALLVARDANLLPNTPSRRLAAMVGYQPHPDIKLSVEAGHEKVNGQDNHYVGLRLMWSASTATDIRW